MSENVRYESLDTPEAAVAAVAAGKRVEVLTLDGWAVVEGFRRWEDWFANGFCARVALPTTPPTDADLEEVADYFRQRSDVVDGDYGQPEANEEMRMLALVEGVQRRLTAPQAAGEGWEVNHKWAGWSPRLASEVESLRVRRAALAAVQPGGGFVQVGWMYDGLYPGSVPKFREGPGSGYTVPVYRLAAAPKQSQEGG